MTVSLETKLGTDQYIVYDLVKPQYIDWDFYRPYLTKEPPFSQIGLAVYLRTYSRYIPEVNRREKWCETVLRVVEHSLSLDEKTLYIDKQEEAKELFDAIFNLRVFPAGRALWIGGTEAVKRSPSAVFNCSYSNIDSLSSIVEGFYLLLVGAGFGFSIQDKYVSKLPSLNKDLEVYHYPYRMWKKGFSDTSVWFCRSEKDISLDANIIELDDITFDDFLDSQLNRDDREFVLTVGDSKEGWCTALKFLLWAYSKDFDRVSIDYSCVRPKGTPLKTFGGRASGHGALQEFFERIHAIVNESEECSLQSTQVLDICNAMGAAVVVGGVRRSSEIALGDMNDTAFIEAKKDLWSDPDKANKTAYRTMSNNSVVLYDNPGLDWFKETMELVKTNGEPGVVSIGNMNKKLLERCKKFRIEFFERKGSNPCLEILLDNRGVCNLSEINLNAHVIDNNIDWDLLAKSVRLATHVGSRMTLVKMFHSEWDRVQKRDRLLGVSLTGIMTAFDRLGIDMDSVIPALNSTVGEYVFKKLQDIVDDESFKYHDQLGIPRPLLATCIKPSGTLSLLPGVSSGIHRDYAPYYLRRVRVSNSDPIAHALRSLGVPCCPENGQGDDLEAERCKTWVFTFPVKTDTPIRSIDEPAIKQLERYKLSMKHWTQHSTSVTISVDEDEWNSVAEWLYESYDDFVGVSFLPKFDSYNSPYPQLPMESCDKETYEHLAAKMPRLTEEQFIALIASKETFYEDYELDSSCSSGVCPVR
jgi:adenosylcobalamin-dependent ribonucleoside-triphosphate reductase